MMLLAGLGNPGPKYAYNRHNIGFIAIDEIAEHHGFAPWRSKFQGHMSEGMLGSEKVLLLKPQTFMNLSGQSIGEALRFYKLGPADLTVLYDEVDLAPGKVRVKQGGGHAGHNGLRDIVRHIGPAFRRVRLGIGHPGHKDKVSPHVLSNFSKADETWLDPLIKAIGAAAPLLVEPGGGKFMTKVALLAQDAP